MRFRLTQYLTALRVAQDFLDGHAHVTDSLNSSGARRAFDACVARIADLGEEQWLHQIGESAACVHERQRAAEFRRTWLLPLRRMAAMFAPELPELAHLAAPRRRWQSTELAESARVLGDQLAPYEARFVEAGLPPDFLHALAAATDDLLAVVARKGLHRTRHVKATAALACAERDARRALGALDGLVQRAFLVDSPELVAWRNARRVVRRAVGVSPAVIPAVESAAAIVQPTGRKRAFPLRPFRSFAMFTALTARGVHSTVRRAERRPAHEVPTDATEQVTT